MIRRRTIATAVAGTLAAAAVAFGPAAPAQASGGCSGNPITINSGAGAEPPSQAFGHGHATGNHYIFFISGNIVDWHADNNGGLDGDTPDTHYTQTLCA